MKDKVILFGASKLGKVAYIALKEKFDICFFSDNDSSKWNQEFLGKKIISPKTLPSLYDCSVIIASSYYREISEQLSEMNIYKVKVFNLINKIYLLDGYNLDNIIETDYSIDNLESEDYNEILKKVEGLKNEVKKLFRGLDLKKAKDLIRECKCLMFKDIELIMLRVEIYKKENKFKEAVWFLKKALEKNIDNSDVVIELANLLIELGRFNEALKYFKELKNDSDKKINFKLIDEKIKYLENNHSKYIKHKREKIVFFVKPNFDSFVDDLLDGLSEDFETKKIVVTNYNQIDEGMMWADICWFECCDDLLAYGSKTTDAKKKLIVCRIHGYEVYEDHIFKPNWKNVNHIIIVSPHFKEIFEERIKKAFKGDLNISLISCGVDTDIFPLYNKKMGYNLGFLGYFGLIENIPLTLQIFKTLYEKDHRYKLFLTGFFMDEVLIGYVKHFISDNCLENNITIEDYMDLDEKIEFYNKIDYILVSSIDEGLCYPAAEAMCCGVKPVLNNCKGLKIHYKMEYIFNNISDALRIIEDESYNSQEYRTFIENHYSLNRQNQRIKNLLKELIEARKNELEIENMFSYTSKFGYYLRKNETIQPFMNPWDFLIKNNILISKNLVISQLQNQFKFIVEMYFNGNNNLLDYNKYLTFLFELLRLSNIDNPVINELLGIYSDNIVKTIEQLEKIMITLYPILHSELNTMTSNNWTKVLIGSELNDNQFRDTDKRIHDLYYKLYENIIPIKDYVKSFLVHGSLSTLDYTDYSDVDTYLILKSNIFNDLDKLRYCRKIISGMSTFLYEFDPLQHHGFFIITEMDLNYYPQAFLPIKSIEYGTLILGDRKLKFSLRSSQMESMHSLWILSYGFREMFINKKNPTDAFSLKRYTSRLMLLPSLYLETFLEQFPYKRDSFNTAKQYFSKQAWDSIEIATLLRENWKIEKPIELNKNFYLSSLMLAEECLSKLAVMEVAYEL